MKAHRSLTRRDILRHPASRIALMIASEFYRACERSGHVQNVKDCYERARELMGILETVELPEDVALRLKAVYAGCRERELLREASLVPEEVQRLSEQWADLFSQASAALVKQERAYA